MTQLRSLGNIVKSKISSSFQERPFIENLVDKIVKATRFPGNLLDFSLNFYYFQSTYPEKDIKARKRGNKCQKR